MASDTLTYSRQLDEASNASHYGSTPTVGPPQILAETEAKTAKKWKNSKRLSWALLIVSVLTFILQLSACIISGIHLDALFTRFMVGLWLSVLGMVSSAVGLRAFRNTYESSKCWSMTHFIMCIVSGVGYIILFILAISTTILTKEGLNEFYEIIDYVNEPGSGEESQSQEIGYPNATVVTSPTPNVTTTTPPSDSSASSVLNSIKGEMAISILLIGTTLAFVVLSIVANVIMGRNWYKNRKKSVTIVYMSQDQSGNAQTHSVIVPSKGKVVVLPPPSQKVTAAYQNGT